MRLQDLVRLVRLPLGVFALGDPVAGLYLGGERAGWPYLGAALAAGLLYLGGMALNDLFDLPSDRRLHPGRVLPRGRASPRQALGVGATCLAAGVTLAGLVRPACGATALALVLVIIAYDAGLKRTGPAGDLAMGMCRGLSLLMGLHGAVGFGAPLWAYALALVHASYIAAVTAVSRLEEHAGNVPRRAVGRRLAPGLAVLLATPLLVPDFSALGLVPLAVLAAALGVPLARRPTGWTRPDVMDLVAAAVRGVLLVNACYCLGAGGAELGASLVAVWLLARRVRRRAGPRAPGPTPVSVRCGGGPSAGAW